MRIFLRPHHCLKINSFKLQFLVSVSVRIKVLKLRFLQYLCCLFILPFELNSLLILLSTVEFVSPLEVNENDNDLQPHQLSLLSSYFLVYEASKHECVAQRIFTETELNAIVTEKVKPYLRAQFQDPLKKKNLILTIQGYDTLIQLVTTQELSIQVEYTDLAAVASGRYIATTDMWNMNDLN